MILKHNTPYPCANLRSGEGFGGGRRGGSRTDRGESDERGEDEDGVVGVKLHEFGFGLGYA